MGSRLFLALLAALVVTMVGCKRSPKVAIASGPVASTKSSLVLPEGFPPSSVTSPSPAPVAKQLNDALNAFLEMRGGFPEDINDLTFTKMISAVPPAPPGKKYAVDAKKLQVVLINQ